MGGNQEVREVGSVNFVIDGGVVVGRVGVLENGAAIGSNRDEMEDSGVKVVDGE